MGKALDKTLLSILSATVLFVLFYTLTDSVILGAIAALLALLSFRFLLHSIRPKTPKDRLSLRDFIRYVLLNGNSVLKSAIELSFPTDATVTDADGNTLVTEGEKRYLLYYAFKFGALSEEDVAKCYRLAKKYDAHAIYALTNHAERKALAVTEYVPQRFSVVSAHTVYKYLMKKGLLPTKSCFCRKKTKVSNFFRIVINGSNVKYYLICGLSTSLIALITPFRIYYLTFAFLNLLLAILSLVFSEKNAGDCELFKR